MALFKNDILRNLSTLNVVLLFPSHLIDSANSCSSDNFLPIGGQLLFDLRPFQPAQSRCSGTSNSRAM